MKKIFTLIAMAAMAIGANAQKITFNADEGKLASWDIDGFKLTYVDDNDKIAVDANNCYFGTAEEYVKYWNRTERQRVPFRRLLGRRGDGSSRKGELSDGSAGVHHGGFPLQRTKTDAYGKVRRRHLRSKRLRRRGELHESEHGRGNDRETQNQGLQGFPCDRRKNGDDL